MSEVLVLEHVSLAERGPTVSLSLAAGQSLAIVGGHGDGKSWLCAAIAGDASPARGKIERATGFSAAEAVAVSRRSRPQTLAGGESRSRRDKGQHSAATDALTALGLWEHRRTSVSDLSPGLRTACELLGPLASREPLLILDGQLDHLDPWVLPDTLKLLERRMEEGAAVVISTIRPQIAAKMNAIVVLRNSEIRFAGSPADLLRQALPSRLEVHTDNRPQVRALVQPFEVSMQEFEDGIQIAAPEGQALAARLLTEGYGDVKFVVLREPTLEEALLGLR